MVSSGKKVAQLGTALTNYRIVATETEVIGQYFRWGRKVEVRFPIAGARASAEDTVSGWRGQHHQLTVTVDAADGQQAYYTRTVKGASGRQMARHAQRFAVEVNRAAVIAAKPLAA